MKCREAIVLVEKLVDGEASAAERLEVEAHLASCEGCRLERAFLERVTITAGEARATPTPPPGYWDELPGRILARIDGEKAGARPNPWFRSKAYSAMALAATLVIAVTIGLTLHRERTLEQPEPMRAMSEAAPGGTPAETQIREAIPPTARDEAAPAAPTAAAPAPAEQDARRDADSLRRLGYVAPDDAGEREQESLVAARSRRPAEPEQAEEANVNVGGTETEIRVEMSRAMDSAAAPSAFRTLEAEPEPDPEPGPGRASRSRVEQDCGALRKGLEALPTGPERTGAMYELALCSIRRYQEQGSVELRDIAVADVNAFLALEAEGTRASDLKQALAQHQ